MVNRETAVKRLRELLEAGVECLPYRGHLITFQANDAGREFAWNGKSCPELDVVLDWIDAASGPQAKSS